MPRQRERKRRPVLIAAGGTGGHVFPALAIAQGLREQDLEVIWLGTRRGIESRVVPENDFAIHYINVVGVRGKNLIDWVIAPFLLLWAIARVVMLMIRIRPCCVLGMGGFASAAAGFAALLCAKPLIIQEQNAVAGTTNKLLAPIARKIFTGFPNVFQGKNNVFFSGNPLREAFYRIEVPDTRLAREGPVRLLVVGGSLGARVINEVVPPAIARICDADPNGIEVVHQSGASDEAQVRAAYRSVGVTATVRPFIESMATEYARADLVIARAGALTVAELAAVGVAAVLIPYPHAIDDHQSLNAQWLVDVGAAIKIPQEMFTQDTLWQALTALLNDKADLIDRAMKARSLAMPHSTDDIVKVCREYAYV